MSLKLKKYYLTLVTCLFSIVSFAQENPPADDDPPPGPINNYIIWLFIFGIIFVIFYLNNRKAVVK